MTEAAHHPYLCVSFQQQIRGIPSTPRPNPTVACHPPECPRGTWRLARRQTRSSCAHLVPSVSCLSASKSYALAHIRLPSARNSKRQFTHTSLMLAPRTPLAAHRGSHPVRALRLAIFRAVAYGPLTISSTRSLESCDPPLSVS